MKDDQSEELVTRLHKATGLSLDCCLQYLSMVVAPDKEALVAEFEQGKRRFGPKETKKR